MLNRIFYRAAILVVLAFAALITLLPTPDATVTASDDSANEVESSAVVFANVDVFDGETMLRQQTVVVDGGKVIALGDAVTPPTGATSIDGTGHTLLPGFVDAHTHSWGQALSDAARFGVTTMLDMFTDPANMGGIREDRTSFDTTAKTALFSAGMLATAEGGHGTQFGIAIETLSAPEQANAWVDARIKEGSDYIKLVYDPYAGRSPSIDLATATAVIEAAHARDLLAVAHVTDYQAADDLIDAGIDGFVHVFIDKPADSAFVQKAVDAGVFIIPTLAVIASINGEQPGLHWLEDDPLTPLLSNSQRATLTQSFGRFPGIRALEYALQSIQALYEAGVPILAGTDAPNPGTGYGVSMHDELELLTRAGMSELDALRAATSAPMTQFPLDNSNRGSISVGGRADLVLVEGDPSADILATRNIKAVYRNGQAVPLEVSMDTKSASTPMPASLADFEPGTPSIEGLLWTTTTDSMMGGKSEATTRYISPGANGSDTAWEVVATNAPGFPYPWSGFYLDASTIAPADISNYTRISFAVRGTPARYRFMLFTADALGVPPTIEFDATEDWQTVTLTLADAGTFNAEQFVGFAIVTPLGAGEYTFAIDDVKLVQ